MTESNNLAENLQFVRSAVETRDGQQRPIPLLSIMWAGYVLIGYTLMDLEPNWAGLFFTVGGVGGGLFSWWAGRRASIRRGVINRRLERSTVLHWFVGFLLIFVSVTGLACEIPILRGTAGSQVAVIMIGLLEFFYGVHVAVKRYLWAGPLIMLGGVLVGLVPRYGWTALGVVIAAMILSPLLFRRPASNNP